MELLLVRHAKAEERELFALSGADDALRPLTKPGAKQMRRVAKGLRELLPQLEVVASSPFTRALQTADILAAAYRSRVVQLPQLAPGHPPAELLSWLRSQGDCERVALVGHEPDLGVLAAWLLTGREQGFLPFRKGGAALLQFPEGLKGGQAQLAWLLTPAQLRMLAS